MAYIKERIITILILISYNLFIVSGDDFKEENVDKGAHSDRGVWFGPRLGKRSSQPLDNSKSTLFKLLEAADAVNYYYNQLPYDMQAEAQVDKRIIFTPKLGRAIDESRGYDNMEYTPRLGRRKLTQEFTAPSEDDVYNYDPPLASPRMNSFSPRLGRNYNFSPRLGRELSNELFPRVRVSRSVNDTKST